MMKTRNQKLAIANEGTRIWHKSYLCSWSTELYFGDFLVGHIKIYQEGKKDLWAIKLCLEDEHKLGEKTTSTIAKKFAEKWLRTANLNGVAAK